MEIMEMEIKLAFIPMKGTEEECEGQSVNMGRGYKRATVLCLRARALRTLDNSVF